MRIQSEARSCLLDASSESRYGITEPKLDPAGSKQDMLHEPAKTTVECRGLESIVMSDQWITCAASIVYSGQS